MYCSFWRWRLIPALLSILLPYILSLRFYDCCHSGSMLKKMMSTIEKNLLSVKLLVNVVFCCYLHMMKMMKKNLHSISILAKCCHLLLVICPSLCMNSISRGLRYWLRGSSMMNELFTFPLIPYVKLHFSAWMMMMKCAFGFLTKFHYTLACVRFSWIHLLWQLHFWHLDEDEKLYVQIHFRHLGSCKNSIFLPWKRKVEISTFKYFSLSAWVCLASRHLSQPICFYTWMMMMKCCFNYKFALCFLHICLCEIIHSHLGHMIYKW